MLSLPGPGFSSVELLPDLAKGKIAALRYVPSRSSALAASFIMLAGCPADVPDQPL
jgi:hypothetical protein